MPRIEVTISSQQLDLLDDGGALIKRYPVSTATRGPGELNGSYCTPRGQHVIRARIGAGQPPNTVFVDWILTRILWLSGCEPGFNRLGDVDTMRRYIYIHGSPDAVEMGRPGSIGCIRMRNADIVDLFDRVDVGTAVKISV